MLQAHRHWQDVSRLMSSVCIAARMAALRLVTLGVLHPVFGRRGPEAVARRFPEQLYRTTRDELRIPASKSPKGNCFHRFFAARGGLSREAVTASEVIVGRTGSPWVVGLTIGWGEWRDLSGFCVREGGSRAVNGLEIRPRPGIEKHEISFESERSWTGALLD